MKRIGVDVGGTNTDAVLIDGETVVCTVKSPTTTDIYQGIDTALRAILARSGVKAEHIGAVMVGTTQFNNAILERNDLSRVAAIRISYPAGRALPPFTGWPDDLARRVRGDTHLVRGGYDFDGFDYVPLDRAAIAEAARRIASSDLGAVAITSMFSPLSASCEEEAAEIVRRHCPELSITLSHRFGRIGMIARENATIMNAALTALAKKMVRSIRQALADLGFSNARLYVSQNDGTLSLANVAEDLPVFSFASGATNSMRGAGFLSGLSDAAVIDVGGTTSDIGRLIAGFPREISSAVNIGGVCTQFRMPDIVSLLLGGGTVLSPAPLTVGGYSVAHQLEKRALIFGGKDLTLTDMGVCAGLIELGDRSLTRMLGADFAHRGLELARTLIGNAVGRVRGAEIPPLVPVGGGAFMISDQFDGVAEVVRVKHHEVANAFGAAMGQVSGQVDKIFNNVDREDAIEEAKAIAIERAVEAGADPATLIFAEVEDAPLTYHRAHSIQVKVRVVGSILELHRITLH